MTIRMETLTCLKERLLNVGPAGSVFASAQDQQKWLLGAEGASPGLVRDPKAAMAETVSGAKLHHGVAISETEESEIRKFLGKLFATNAGLLPQFAMDGSLSDGIALSCPDPTNPACWY